MNPITRKEIRDAVRNRWVGGYAAVLGILGFAAAWFGLKTTGGMAVQMFGRTTATITNLSLLLAPLVALVLGASTIATERDKGTMQRLLSQPITPGELLLSKHFGLLIALAVATVIGFAPAALMIGIVAGGRAFAYFTIFPAITMLLIASMTAIGVLISSTAKSGSKALGSAVLAWFGFVLLYDLILIGSLLAASLSPRALIGLVIANPVDAARILVVLILEPDLHALGPAGAALLSIFGRRGAIALLLAIIAVWSVVPVLLGVRRFHAFIYRRQARTCSENTLRVRERNADVTSYSFAKAPEAGGQ